MVEKIRGAVVEEGEGYLVVECGCFAFKLLTPRYEGLAGREISLFTEIVIPSEGSPVLYGFKTKEERNLFRLLVKVPKVGSKVALSVLSHFSPNELSSIVREGKSEELLRVPGLGKKLAQRIIVELRGKLEEEGGNVPEELYSLLRSLGYKKQEIREALREVELSSLPVEEALKVALRRLSGETS